MINRPVFISMLVSIALLSPVAADPRRGEQTEARQDMRLTTMSGSCAMAARCWPFAGRRFKIGPLPGGRTMLVGIVARPHASRNHIVVLQDSGASWPD